jgi:RsiW-degrading membrane proteinase PrsW (M82 family)
MSTLATILTAPHNFPLPIKIILAFLGGVIPVLIWLYFWEHEDKHPEPTRSLIYAFLAGMLAVAVALPFEAVVLNVVNSNTLIFSVFFTSPMTITIILWAAVEELLKFAAAYFAVLSRAENDEPIDSMIYMITVALGFSALENGLFLFQPIFYNQTIQALTTGNLRFIGATLLHTITSGVIGLALALSFYRSKKTRRLYVTIGVITAILLHAFFNLSIIIFNSSEPLIPFFAVWIAIVLFLLAFEKVKQMRQAEEMGYH